jgi:type II secretory pathway pseudopilin PulG
LGILKERIFNMIKTTQSGRSMVEMLGVLAIVGVLSIAGISGYSMAMNKYRISRVLDQVQLLSTNIRTLYATQSDYNGINTALLYNVGVIGDDMCKASGNCAQKAKNAFGAGIVVQAESPDAFSVAYDGLPASACVQIAVADWGSAASGLIKIKVGQNEYSGTSLPISVTNASTACSSATNTITWYMR